MMLVSSRFITFTHLRHLIRPPSALIRWSSGVPIKRSTINVSSLLNDSSPQTQRCPPRQVQHKESNHNTFPSKESRTRQKDFKRNEFNEDPAPPPRRITNAEREQFKENNTPGRLYLEEVILDQNSTLNWPEISAKCFEIDPKNFNPRNFGGLLLGLCIQHNSLKIAKDYLHQEPNPSLAALSSYIRLLGAKNEGKIDEEEIFSIYKKILGKCRGIWEQEIGLKVIDTLCQTSKWRECLPIIEGMKTGGEFHAKPYAQVAGAAFTAQEFDLGWDFLENKVGMTKSISNSEALIAWLRSCPPPRNESQLVRALQFIDNFDHCITEPLLKEIVNYFATNLDYSGVATTINKDGVCSKCKGQLDQVALSPAEFETLRSSFFERVLCDSDVFLNTTPVELESYRDFIEKNAPFDYILDGLNITFAKSGRDQRRKTLVSVVKALSGRRIFVIGRKHMAKTLGPELDYISRSAHIHLINDLSQDDPFMIYAALKSGPECRFISRDLMRAQSFRLLDNNTSRLFKRWRLTAQLFPDFDVTGNRVKLTPFVNTPPLCQRDPKSGNWHIPYEKEEPISKYDFPTKWICFSPNKG